MGLRVVFVIVVVLLAVALMPVAIALGQQANRGMV